MKNIISLVSGLAVAVSFFASTANAGTVHVKNENKKALQLKIVPEKAGSTVEYMPQLSADQDVKFTIDKSNIDDSHYYMIKGYTVGTMFTSITGDSCQHLSVDKDYTVTFQDVTTGVNCRAEEMSASVDK